jgi:hypothetical protein
MADHSVFSTAGRTPSAEMDDDPGTVLAPEAAIEVVDAELQQARRKRSDANQRCKSTMPFEKLDRFHKTGSGAVSQRWIEALNLLS